MYHDRRPPVIRTFAAWPGMLALSLVVLAICFLRFGQTDVRADLRPATGTAQAMALASHPADADPATR